MTVKRTFVNVCSISDRHVLELLPLFDLRTSDPLFDGESSSWRADMAATKYGPEQTEKTVERPPPGEPLTAIGPPGS